MAVTHNLKHVQVAKVEATPIWVDVPGAIAFEPAATSESTAIRGDATVYVSAYGAPEGEFDLTWLDVNFAPLGVMNGGTISTAGTGGTLVDKYIQLATYVAPIVAFANWEPNIAGGVHAGLRTTIPAANCGLARKASGQETVGEWSVNGSFKAGGGNTLFIYELMATEPTYASGVFAVTLP